MQGGNLLQGKEISTLQVGFATNATVYDTAPTQSDISSKVTGTGNSTSSSSSSCSEECTIYNLTCAVEKKCYSRIALFFGYIGIALVVGKPLLQHLPTFFQIKFTFAPLKIHQGSQQTTISNLLRCLTHMHLVLKLLSCAYILVHTSSVLGLWSYLWRAQNKSKTSQEFFLQTLIRLCSSA
jgi:hypothetical protein